MTEQTPNDAPVGTPKMVIEGFNPFEGPAVNKQVVIDSNDLSPLSEAESLWLRALAFPPRPVDLTLQAVCWVSSTCFITSALKAGVAASLPVVGIGLLVIALPSALAGLYAFTTFPRLQPLIIYRLLLIAIGCVVGFYL
ncbi:MAG TPA: hypothetical protein V6D34_04955 [Candidatus Sericytochromatia bacterium]|jgi:hypothetical protein